jgi:hypothetical protein
MWWSAHGELRRRENRAPRWQGLPEVEAAALGGQDARMESYIEAHMRRGRGVCNGFLAACTWCGRPWLYRAHSLAAQAGWQRGRAVAVSAAPSGTGTWMGSSGVGDMSPHACLCIVAAVVQENILHTFLTMGRLGAMRAAAEVMLRDSCREAAWQRVASSGHCGGIVQQCRHCSGWQCA